MPFFQNLQRGKEPTYFFFPQIYQPGLTHFLQEENITGWNMTSKANIVPLLPEGFQIPEVRLTDTAPRVEKRVSCLVSYFSNDSIQDAYLSLIYSQAWINWHNNNAAQAMADYEFENAMAKDPGPLDINQPS